MFIGMALIPPVLLKLGSTGYRFARYYTGARVYREKGPPPLLLRLLAPLLVITTIIIFATGVVLLVSGHRSDLVFNLHKVSFIVWSGCFGVHFLAHAPQTAARAADRLETLEPAPDPRLGAAARARDRLDRRRPGAGARGALAHHRLARRAPSPRRVQPRPRRCSVRSQALIAAKSRSVTTLGGKRPVPWTWRNSSSSAPPARLGPRRPWAWSPWQLAQPSPLRANACRPAAAGAVPLASATSSCRGRRRRSGRTGLRRRRRPRGGRSCGRPGSPGRGPRPARAARRPAARARGCGGPA